MKISHFQTSHGWRILRGAVDGFKRHQSGRTAAYLAYTTLFALVPLMAVSFWLVSRLPQLSSAETSLRHWLFANLLPAAGKEVEIHLSAFADQAVNLQGAGLGMLFLTCLLMVRRIEVVFNTLWEVPEQRAGVRGLAVYWSIVTLGPCLLASVFLAFTWLASLTGLGAALGDSLVPSSVQGLFPVMVMSAVLTLAYALMPNTRVAWRHAALGGVAAALLFDVLRHMAVFLIGLFPGYQVIYGAFAAVPLFLLWIEAGWAIVLWGAHLSAAAHLDAVRQCRVGAGGPEQEVSASPPPR